MDVIAVEAERLVRVETQQEVFAQDRPLLLADNMHQPLEVALLPGQQRKRLGVVPQDVRHLHEDRRQGHQQPDAENRAGGSSSRHSSGDRDAGDEERLEEDVPGHAVAACEPQGNEMGQAERQDDQAAGGPQRLRARP